MRLKRLRNVEENPLVSLAFDRYDEDWGKLGWVMVQGAATIIEGGVEHERAVSALRSRYEQYRSMFLEGRPLIRVSVEKVASWGNLT
jgi:PPOX class probable F420-dependent enzyme